MWQECYVIFNVREWNGCATELRNKSGRRDLVSKEHCARSHRCYLQEYRHARENVLKDVEIRST